MQRHQHVIASFAKGADPVLRRTRSGIAHQLRSFGGSGRERAERLKRKRRNTIFDLQRNHSRPGNAHVQAVVGLVARDVGWIVSRSRLEAHMPVFGGGDLRRVGFIAADKPSEQLACLGGMAHC